MRGTSGAGRHIYLLGNGISYSASPAMQNAAFEALGLDWTYEMLDIPPDQLPEVMRRLRSADAGGANVTIPYKHAVMEHLDGIDAEALRARAVNTIAKDGERLIGSNTDVDGIRAALAEVALEPRGADVIVLGAGGSARAAAVALDGAHLTFVARRPDETDVPGRVVAWGDASWSRQARSLALRTADGWGILLAQGARSFEIWTGRPAPLEAMRQTLPR